MTTSALQIGISRFLERVPECYKCGPWHPVALITLTCIYLFLLCSASSAASSTSSYSTEAYEYNVNPAQSQLVLVQELRVTVSMYMFAVVGCLYYYAGPWPLASYTVTSWNILALRLLSSYLGEGEAAMPIFQVLAQALRFPALIGACITVSIWWLVLVPTIAYILHDHADSSRLSGFLRFNFSPLLLNLHLLNLPIALADFYWQSQPLTFSDLWISLVVAKVYILFYLNVLDRRGLHFYIVFSPRTAWSGLTYSSVLLLYVCVYNVARNAFPYSYK